MLKNLLKNNLLFLDGALGSVLQHKGLKPGELPEIWNITHKLQIIDLHYKYFEAGSNIINTNTFGANLFHYDEPRLKTIISAALKNVLTAKNNYIKKFGDSGNKFISFDMGPTGKLLKPMGDLDFEDAINIFKTSFEIALGGGDCTHLKNIVDCVTLETFGDVYEAKAAIIALKETQEKLHTDIPVLMSFAFDKSCRTLTGSDAKTVTAIMEGLGVDALGVNCSLGPRDMTPVIKEFLKYSSTPVIVKPNAGLPHDENGLPVYDVDSNTFAMDMREIAKMGASLLGGCCGTDENYIKELVSKVHNIANNFNNNGDVGNDNKCNNIERFEYKQDCLLNNLKRDKRFNDCNNDGYNNNYKDICVAASCNSAVYFRGRDDNLLPVLIGERINPTGKKRFKEALRNNDISYITNEALKQEAAGAMALDINVGLPEIDENKMMLSVMQNIQSVTTLPLQIDTTNSTVMENALRRYNGKALVNSVNGKEEVMHLIFPIVKKYGGVVIALLLDESGIPDTAQKRIEIAKKIYQVAKSYGINKRDILIDALTMAVSSNINAAKITLEVVKEITLMGGRTVLGVSNISFGLPQRPLVTSAFFTMALQMGLSGGIVNVCDDTLMTAYKTYCLMAALDENCLSYIDWAGKLSINNLNQINQIPLDSKTQTLTAGQTTQNNNIDKRPGSIVSNDSPLCYAIIHGVTNSASTETKKLLESGIAATKIIDDYIMSALNYVGECFEKKTMYLPQLLMASDATKAAFEVIKATITTEKSTGESGAKIIVATVKGDIHDIGKNIVKTLLENYGFCVIDLGKDVPPNLIVSRCKEDNVKMVGLSALMTTTVASMDETIKLLRVQCPDVKICVGGAVMTQTYADKIGADFYAKDAMATVNWAQKISATIK